jgi:hypothetical protein
MSSQGQEDQRTFLSLVETFLVGRDIPGSSGGRDWDVRESNPDGMKEAKEDMPGNPGKGGRELDSGLILKP